MHVKSSDWLLHGHSSDKAYDSIILHIVYENDIDLSEHSFRKVPTVELKSQLDSDFMLKYQDVFKDKKWIYCEDKLDLVDAFTKVSWLERLLIERLERKSQDVLFILDRNKGDWEKTLLCWISKSFGFKYNVIPFEILGNTITLSHVINSKNLNALIFGLSGLLPSSSNNFFVNSMIEDFEFERRKWNLTPMPTDLWKVGGIRPPNSPYIRIAQLSAFLEKYRSGLLNNVIGTSNKNEFRAFFENKTNEYWETHFAFGKASTKRNTRLSQSAIDLIITNAIVPFMFIYGKMNSKPDVQSKALEIINELKAEKNGIIEKWRELGFETKSAADTQALLELYNGYCSVKKCLFCNIGNKLLLK